MIPWSPLRKLLCLLLLLMVVPGSESAGQGTREAMVDAMARMMEAMGLFDSAPTQQAQGGASGWGSALGAPWDDPNQDRSRTMTMGDLMRQFTRQIVPPGEGAGEKNSDWPPTRERSRLEGVWEGRDGGLLIIQGGRFRIYSPTLQRVDGLIRIQGDHLALYNPLDRQARPFEFAEHQGRLIMRDLSGRLYLYRRPRLGDGQGL